MQATDEHIDDAAIVRGVLGVVAAAVLCLFAGGVAGVVVVRDRPAAVTRQPGELPPVVPSGGIGPLEGALVVDYVTRRGDALRAASGRRAAVVSFITYRNLADTRAAVSGTDLARLLVALPGGAPVVASADPEKELQAAAAHLTREAEEMVALADTTEDKAFKDDYQAEARARRSQAAWAADPRAEVVFAAVVVADAASLRTLARAPGVRLVDVGGASVPSALRGLRPEEATTVGAPATRPA